jgi:hypothetical protein
MCKILKYDRGSSFQDFVYEMVVFVLNASQFCHHVRCNLNVLWRFFMCEGYVDIKYEVLRVGMNVCVFFDKVGLSCGGHEFLRK